MPSRWLVNHHRALFFTMGDFILPKSFILKKNEYICELITEHSINLNINNKLIFYEEILILIARIGHFFQHDGR